ncbi:MAG: efflux RND transporter periplasmic adaptor subunit [Cyclobacteriaceae bacterium]|nr:efflux RND transporter periplasmic adaptor subunit [Cyclobacteriaceae bacterium]
MRHIIILIAVILFSCQSNEEHGHAHNEAGGHITEGEEIPTVDTTIWTNKTELFVEYPALIVGNTSHFAAHFTVLDRHQPVREGAVTVSLLKDGKGIRHTVDAPSSPGIFKPSLQPKETGIYQLIFDIKTPTITDRIVISDVYVFSTAEEAKEVLGDEEEGNSISFLKEQAWKIEFQTAPVIQNEIFDVIYTSGVWKVSPTDYKTLVSTADGTVTFKGKKLTEGSKVKKGQVLMTVSSTGLTSNNLSAEIAKAKANFQQSKSAYERNKKLYTSKIVPKSEFEQIERKYEVDKSIYETLSAGYSSGGKQVVVPFDGYLKSLSVDNGSFVEQGAALVVITSHKSSLLETQVSPSYAFQLQNIHDVWYQPKSGKWSSLNKTGGKILSVGKEVGSKKPLLSVFAQINDVVEMPEGNYTEVQLTFGNPVLTTIVPKSALLEDYGNYSVVVELSGESFERRPVTVGKRNGEQVEIITGLTVGEMVVTKGAYQVKMASMSGAVPAHGHDH